MARNLTTESQKFEKTGHEIQNPKIELQNVKYEKKDMHGRLKITLFELEVKHAFLNKMNTCSKTLANILCSQKSPFDRSSLGYDHGASTSRMKGKTIFASSVANATPRTAHIHNVMSSFKKRMSRVARISTIIIVKRNDTFIPIVRS